MRTLRHVVLPQAVITMLPSFGNQLVELLKATSLVSLITLTDLTFAGSRLITATGRPDAGAAAVFHHGVSTQPVDPPHGKAPDIVQGGGTLGRRMQFDIHFVLEILPDLLRGAVITLEATLGGFLVALAGGLILAVARRTRLAAPALAYIEFMRNTPLLVQIYAIFYVLPFAGLTLGVLALGLNYSAYTAEVYRAGIESVPQAQWEAARSLGLSLWTTWTRVVLPQAIRPILPVLGNYLIGMFKDTPLLATITVPEMFNAAMQVAGTTYRYNEPYTLVALIFLAMSYPASLPFRSLERARAVSDRDRVGQKRQSV
jgi:polar amino acid transport system permease protein